MAEADPQDGQLTAKLLHGLDADTGISRVAGPGGENDGIRGPPPDFSRGDGVIPNNLALLPKLLKVAGKVVDEAVKIVDE